jgi:hypothetical protein
MKKIETRNYNCKDEELPVICRNALVYLKRDIIDFSTFSPVFNGNYLNVFETKIDSIDELVSPKIETDEVKKITRRLYHTMDGLSDPIAKIRGYLRLAKASVEVSAKDFGLTVLSQKIAARDAEGVRQNLLLVVAFLKKYKEPLNAVGLNDSIIEQLEAAVSSVTNDNRLQFDITDKRKAIVQSNVEKLNDLYKQVIDILSIGKSLYKTTDPSKYKEYSFNALLKSVRNTK